MPASTGRDMPLTAGSTRSQSRAALEAQEAIAAQGNIRSEDNPTDPVRPRLPAEPTVPTATPVPTVEISIDLSDYLLDPKVTGLVMLQDNHPRPSVVQAANFVDFGNKVAAQPRV